MKILLDTHTWIWMIGPSDRLSPDATARLNDSRNELFLSAASSWEIAIKWSLGRLTLPDPPDVYVPQAIRRSGVRPFPVEHAHALHVATLPAHHRDPFDRLLVAQAQMEGMAIITSDARFRDYEVSVIPAS